MDTLKAEKRDLSVKAKKLRREGYVTSAAEEAPAVLDAES